MLHFRRSTYRMLLYNEGMAKDSETRPGPLPLDAAEFDRQMRNALAKPPMPEPKPKKSAPKKTKEPPKR